MTILFDHQTFSIQNYGGISRYFERLITGIDDNIAHQADLGVWRSDNDYVHRPAPFSTVRFKGRKRLLYAINRWYSLNRIRQGNFDLLHATYYDPYFLTALGPKPFVMTIHDMIHERLYEQFPALKPDQYVAGKRLLAQKAAAIITVSEYTRQDVISLLAVDPARVHVVYHASSLTDRSNHTPLPYNPPYLLFVGNRGHYKNFDGLLQAFGLLSDFPALRLVCAGGGPFSPAERTQLANLGVADRVHHHAFQTDQALTDLYQAAAAFVFPSFYEGFGIPVLEAFSCGCPCVLSHCSSLPEVAQQAALYVDPADPANMATVLRALLLNPDLQAELVEKGYQRLKAFTWQKAVDQTLAIYQSVLAA